MQRSSPKSSEPRRGTIYALALDRAPDGFRYVGRTVQPLRRRLRNHLDGARKPESRTFHLPVAKWIVKHEAAGDEIVIVELESVDETELDDAERRWIADLRGKGYRLLNVTDGGHGGGFPVGYYKHNDAARVKMREAAKHRGPRAPVSEETRERLRAAHEQRDKESLREWARQVGKANAGRTHTPEARARMSAAGRGKPKSESHRKAISDAMKARKNLK